MNISQGRRASVAILDPPPRTEIPGKLSTNHILSPL
jgi:hypothetical protein